MCALRSARRQSKRRAKRQQRRRTRRLRPGSLLERRLRALVVAHAAAFDHSGLVGRPTRMVAVASSATLRVSATKRARSSLAFAWAMNNSNTGLVSLLHHVGNCQCLLDLAGARIAAVISPSKTTESTERVEMKKSPAFGSGRAASRGKHPL